MKSLFFIIPVMLIPALFITITPPQADCSKMPGYNKDNSTLSTGFAKSCNLTNQQVKMISTLGFIPIAILPLLFIMRILFLGDEDDVPDKKLIKQLESEIPNAESLTKIPCALCSKNVDRPYNLIKHLGVEQTKQYLSFCDETKTEPTLYCCSCYAMVEKNPNWQRAMDKMIDDSIKYGELKKINLIKSQEERI